jgi:hypothetical protein
MLSLVREPTPALALRGVRPVPQIAKAVSARRRGTRRFQSCWTQSANHKVLSLDQYDSPRYLLSRIDSCTPAPASASRQESNLRRDICQRSQRPRRRHRLHRRRR